MVLTVVDLFSGLGGFSEAFYKNGHDVVRVDLDPQFKDIPNTLLIDVFDLNPKDLPSNPDVLLMSPPCNCFSVASIGHYWESSKVCSIPKEDALEAIRLVKRALELVEILEPRFWLLENPMGMLRNILGKPTYRTWFCIWLDPRLYAESENGKILTRVKFPPKKPTDLWGNWTRKMEWKKPIEGSWEKSPRGSKLGVQGQKSAAERAKIPFKLSMALLESIIEHDRLGLEDPIHRPLVINDPETQTSIIDFV